MHIRKNLFVKITSVFFMMIMTGILYASVYYHFLTQTDGTFALGIYAGGLFLLLLMIMLILKLTALKKQETHNVFIILEIMAVVILMAYGLYLRTLPEVIFNSQNTGYFDIAVSLQDGMMMPNMDVLVRSILAEPSLFGYGKIMSYGFALLGRKPEVLYYSNLFFQMLSIFFVYRITRRVAGKQAGIAALILCIYLPSQIYSSYTLNDEALFSCIFFGTLWLYLYLAEECQHRDFDIPGVICQVVLGVLFAIMIFTEPVSAILAVIMIIALFFWRKNGIRRGLITTASTVFIFALLLLWMSSELMTGYLQTGYAFIKEFIPELNVMKSSGVMLQIEMVCKQFGAVLAEQGNDITLNYESLLYMDGLRISTAFAGLLQAINQFVYLWTVLLSFLFGLYLLIGRNIRNKDRNAVLIMWLTTGSAAMLFLQMNSISNMAYYVCLLVILSAVSLKYIYLAFVDSETIEADEEIPAVIRETKEPGEKKVKESKKKKTKESKEKDTKVEAEERQSMPAAIETPTVPETTQEPVQYIENPLPLPKKHVKKNRIDFSVEPTENQMNYDVEVPDDADWDY